MTIALIIALVIITLLLVLIVASLVGSNATHATLANKWASLYAECDADYIALEQGRDEESEAYEMQFLSFQETIEHQNTALAAYVEDFHFLVEIIDDFPEIIDAETKVKFEEIKKHVLQEG